MKYGSLFTGIGGFDLGLDRAGFECVWQAEQDAACRRVLDRRFGAVAAATDADSSNRPDGSDPGRGGREGSRSADHYRIYTDVRDIDATATPVDLICGGFPCQDLSVAGRRAGLAGERSGLFFEFMRIASELAPRWVLIENVPGLLSSNEGRDMGTVLGTLGELGYGWAYRVLDAQYFGVAQRRRRVFIVGCLGDSRRAAQVLFEPESGSGDPAPRRETGKRVASGPVFGTLNSGGNSGGFRTEPGEHLVMAPAFSKRPGQQIATRQDGLSYAVTTGEPPRVLRSGVRRLTPLECERLQGFPDGWTQGESDSPRYKMLGNAVAVPVAEWIARRIVEAA